MGDGTIAAAMSATHHLDPSGPPVTRDKASAMMLPSALPMLLLYRRASPTCGSVASPGSPPRWRRSGVDSAQRRAGLELSGADRCELLVRRREYSREEESLPFLRRRQQRL